MRTEGYKYLYVKKMHIIYCTSHIYTSISLSALNDKHKVKLIKFRMTVLKSISPKLENF